MNARDNVVAPNYLPHADRGRVVQSHRAPLNPAGNNPQKSLRENYLQSIPISDKYTYRVQQLRTGHQINEDSRWIINENFYGRALAVANNLRQDARSFSNQFANDVLPNQLNSGIAEYMQFFEVNIQKHMIDTSKNLLLAGQIDVDAFNYCQRLICQPKEKVNQTLRQLFYHFYSGARIRNVNQIRWDADFKKIISSVIDMIKNTFQE